MFRRLRKKFPSASLLNIYRAYVQSKIDYGLSIWGCTTEINLNRVQRIQNLLARIICNNFDYNHSRGIDLVRSLRLQTIRGRRYHFRCVLMFKCTHGLAPIIWALTSPCMLIYMDMIQGALRIWIYIYHGAPRRFTKEVFLYKGSSLWNKLPPWVKESTYLNDFKHNFTLLNGWIHPEFIALFICTPILYPILMLLFYQLCLQLTLIYYHIYYHDIVVFMYDLYLWKCIYVFLISKFSNFRHP